MKTSAAAAPAGARAVESGSCARRPLRARFAGAARAYLKLTKPEIIWLLLVTTVPAMVLAERGWPSTWLVGATLLGGIMTAGGANAINQFADRDIDSQMDRTRRRPIPSGAVQPLHAAVFGVALAASGTVWLVLTVNTLAAILAAGAVVFYALVYTYFLKRSTSQNIVIGGAAGAAPPLIGWVAVTGDVSAAALFLFLIVFLWTPPHFWSLALVLADEYREADVPMLPVVRGEKETARQIQLYSWLLVGLTVVFWAAAQLSLVYLAVAVGAGAVFVSLARRLRGDTNVERAMRLFRYSTLYLALLFAAVLIDGLYI